MVKDNLSFDTFQFKFGRVFVSTIVICLFGMALVNGSHIDDDDLELNNFSYDRVVFRTVKDCSLDKIPDVIDLI